MCVSLRYLKSVRKNFVSRKTVEIIGYPVGMSISNSFFILNSRYSQKLKSTKNNQPNVETTLEEAKCKHVVNPMVRKSKA